MSVLSAERATYAVQRKPLVRDVDLAFEAGTFTAIVGPNGSGKTTLLRLLAGIRPPSAGRVLLDGVEIGRVPRADVACRLSFVPQNTWTEFDITVFDAVAMGRLPQLGAWRSLQRADFDAVHAAIERVDLAGLEQRTLPTLSGGERQRVFIARALAQGSAILVLDEPTSSLDVGHQLELMEVLADLHSEGRTIVAAMHDLHLVWDAFPRSVLLDGGRVAADGATRDVLTGAAAHAAFHVTLRADAEGALKVVR
jgi:iron complex transport system ATP-binding protein